jgi:putative flippase GtrA
VNLFTFLVFLTIGVSMVMSAGLSFVLAAVLNYFLCIGLLFRHKARWNAAVEIFMYVAVVAAVGFVDVATTKLFFGLGAAPWFAKSMSSVLGLVYNFFGRRLVVFPGSGNRVASGTVQTTVDTNVDTGVEIRIDDSR